jgi:hypothetical protein
MGRDAAKATSDFSEQMPSSYIPNEF